MATGDQRGAPDADTQAQRAADRLALALEEAGFDVGRAFPLLTGTVDRSGTAVVDIGRVTAAVAVELAAALMRAAGRGTTPMD